LIALATGKGKGQYPQQSLKSVRNFGVALSPQIFGQDTQTAKGNNSGFDWEIKL